MKKLSVKQQKRLQELNERNETIDQIIVERIADRDQLLPLNLMLEARFNEMMKKGIELEGEITYLQEESDEDYVEGRIEVKKRRLDMLKGQLNEIQNIGEMLKNFDSLGREFEIVRK